MKFKLVHVFCITATFAVAACSPSVPPIIENRVSHYYSKEGTYKIVRLSYDISISEFASMHGVPEYIISKANNVYAPHHLKSGQVVKIPVGYFHKIRQGETIESVAMAYNIDSSYLAEINGIYGSNLTQGEYLQIPISENREAYIPNRSADDTSNISTEANLSKETKLSHEPIIEEKPIKIEDQDKPFIEEKTSKRLSYNSLSSSLDDQSKFQSDFKNTEITTNKEEKPTGLSKVTPPVLSSKNTFKLSSPCDLPNFIWPASGEVISRGKDGIRIKLPVGTDVKASSAGEIAYIGKDVQKYGNLVIMKHHGGYMSAYANLSTISVVKNQRVAMGQIIAKSGQSGNAKEPSLEFSMRKGKETINPEINN